MCIAIVPTALEDVLPGDTAPIPCPVQCSAGASPPPAPRVPVRVATGREEWYLKTKQLEPKWRQIRTNMGNPTNCTKIVYIYIYIYI